MYLPILWIAPLLVAVVPAFAQTTSDARALFDSGRFEDARHAFQSIASREPRNATAAFYLGRISLAAGDLANANRDLERAAELEPGNADHHFWHGVAISNLTPTVSKVKMPFYARRVRKAWERAVEADARHVDARESLVVFYAMAPGAMGGGMDKAEVQAAEVAKLSVMRGASARALIAQVKKDTAAEISSHMAAIAAAPDSSGSYFDAAAALARMGRGAEAFAVLERYARRQPADRWTDYHVGRVAGVTGTEPARGDAALRAFLAAPPRDAYLAWRANAHYWLGQIAAKKGDASAARAHYNDALKINPHSAVARRALESK